MKRDPLGPPFFLNSRRQQKFPACGWWNVSKCRKTLSLWALPGQRVYELSLLTDKAWADEGAVAFLVLADIDPMWQAAKRMWVLLLSLVLVKWLWANYPDPRSRTGHSRCQVLPFTSLLNTKAASTSMPAQGSAKQKANGRTGSGPYPARASAAGLIPSILSSKGGHRPVDVSTV